MDLETKFKVQVAQCKILHQTFFRNVNFNNLLNVFCAAKHKQQKNVKKFKEKVFNKMTITKERLHVEQYYLVQLTHHAVLHKMIPDNTIK